MVNRPGFQVALLLACFFKIKKMEKLFKDYKHFIVADKEGKHPMSFFDGQFCYCDDSTWRDPPWPVKLYSLKRAKQLIKKHNDYRRKNRFSKTELTIMPVDIKNN